MAKPLVAARQPSAVTAHPASQPHVAGGGDGNGVIAVIVTFEPVREALLGLLAALAPQVDKVVLVDNGSAEPIRSWLLAAEGGAALSIFLGANLGLAAGQNIGIAKARELGAAFVLLSDQDSLPAPDMVACLLAAAREKLAEGCRLAAVGPRYFDTLQGSLRPFVRVRHLRVRRFDCGDADSVVEVDHLIASGSLIPVSALDAVGPMTEALFIDYVDTEWSLRAWRKGYRSFGVCRATMRHGLGEKPNYFFGRYVPVHSPLRHYYLFRNAIWLYRQDWIPLSWKVATARRLVLKFGYFALMPSNRLAQLGMMLRGLRDGLRERMGRFGG
jgi:rhamnosyltransferase